MVKWGIKSEMIEEEIIATVVNDFHLMPQNR